MFDFTDPTSNGPRPAARSWPYVAISACASIGSPSVVPVPCASTTSTWPAPKPALASAERITRCCDGPFGAVNPLLAPSCFPAAPPPPAHPPHAPPPACPIRPIRERLAPPIGRQAPLPRKLRENDRRRHQRHP